jgi:hypothetical protein
MNILKGIILGLFVANVLLCGVNGSISGALGWAVATMYYCLFNYPKSKSTSGE